DSGQFRDNTLVIYNQWGDKVFEAQGYTNDPQTAWRGRLNNEPGKDLPDGVYFYVFSTGTNEPPRKGFVEIYR
ncbi:MAG: gliding motility-associated C-terminal domain-containing protein, partial [Thermoanaerobaculia bacterium]|nr:gliding motility-associated C-terminal domain-containing protein [Thermoanaerobaculia bacterium]